MHRDEFHYAVTACFALEGLLVRQVPVEDAARRALLLARSDGMVDWSDDGHVTLADAVGGEVMPVVTQAQASRSVCRLLFMGRGWSNDFNAVQRFHFYPSRPPMDLMELHLLTDVQIMGTGIELHGAQDAGFPGCPHEGYLGHPHRSNRARTASLGRLRWFHKALPADLTWGHCLDPDADDIERCRGGAMLATTAAYRMISGKEAGGLTTMAVYLAADDRDLVRRCRAIWRELGFPRGTDLPDFEPFQGDELRLWWRIAGEAL